MTADRSLPFTMDVSAIAQGSILIYAGSIQEANEILHEREDELIAALAEAAGLPHPDTIDDAHPLEYSLSVSPAMGYEVSGSEALVAGLFTPTRLDAYTTATDYADEGDD